MKKELDIIKVKSDDQAPLWVKYDGQILPQPAYLNLDLETGKCWLAYDPEIGNTIPRSVWNGTVIRWEVSNELAINGCNQLLDDCAELLQRILDGSDVVWDGNNHTGQLTDDAKSAVEELQELIDDGVYESVTVYDVREFLEDWSCDDILKVSASDVQNLANILGIILGGDIDKVLNDMRKNCED